jgi:hypothetical protein
MVNQGQSARSSNISFPLFTREERRPSPSLGQRLFVASRSIIPAPTPLSSSFLAAGRKSGGVCSNMCAASPPPPTIGPVLSSPPMPSTFCGDWFKEKTPNGLFSCSNLVALIGRYEARRAHTSSEEVHFPSYSVSSGAIDLQCHLLSAGTGGEETSSTSSSRCLRSYTLSQWSNA